ncbi:hypothetical protein ACFWTE_13680 [Nocardiopsis sp. NPDC058631]|uniref:hypothetical protein n=1 Tax=Nocardiopsis sp. NPDC058631 TaxID=3346566 RepID=UPI0036641A70
MAVATQQVLGVNRRPLRVGRIRYGLWWLEQTTSGVRGRARTVTGGTAAAGRELLWATELSLRTMTRQAELARPEPWSDRKLLVSATVLAVGAVVVATVLGIGVARWAMTESNSLLFAAAGALAVGLVFLPLAYLVFASKRGCR